MGDVIRELRLPPDALVLARALGDRPGLAVLASDARAALGPRDARFSFVVCEPVEITHEWAPPPSASFPAEGARGWGGFPAAPRWVGAIPYEAGRGLERRSWTPVERRPPPSLVEPVWCRYDAALRIDHATGVVAVEADDSRAADRLEKAVRGRAQGTRSFTLRARPADEPPSAHVERVRRVLEHIARGDVYQVNVARRILFDFQGDALELFARLVKAAPAPYGFFARFGGVTVSAASPELALEARGDGLRTAPIKGTRPRGVDAADDDRLARELDLDPKERAELVMAIDLHRNDLGRVARTGSVRVLGEPRLLRGRTVWSRAAEVTARRAPEGADLEAVLRAVVPCGSVTGAPKVRAMEVIAELEPHRRGLYTGVVGYVGRDGGVVLAMAIRTLELAGGAGGCVGSYFTGGGIVEGSDPERELEETRWKAVQLERLRETWPGAGAGASGGVDP